MICGFSSDPPTTTQAPHPVCTVIPIARSVARDDPLAMQPTAGIRNVRSGFRLLSRSDRRRLPVHAIFRLLEQHRHLVGGGELVDDPLVNGFALVRAGP